jgi:peptide/nickel transport system substrate-binding protein
MKTITRREFLKVSALTVAGAVAASCTTQPVEPTATTAPIETPVAAATATPEPVATAAPETAKEAPQLSELVASGGLPPVEERLGAEPWVVVRENPGFTQEIGTYGGTLRTPRGISQANDYPLLLSSDCKATLPNIAKAWDYSEDGKTFTLYLRKGMKWSDGEPFTAADILFWWEDVQNDERLVSTPGAQWKASGQTMEMSMADDYAVQLKYAEPRYYVHNLIDSTAFGGRQGGGGGDFFLPKHYLTQYHISYNPQADDLAKAEGFEDWTQIIKNRFLNQGDIVVGVPCPDPWMKTEDEVAGNTWERNPYYFKVDPEGNQLPYVDRVVQEKGLDTETHLLKMLGGEVDFEAWGIALGDWPMLSQGQEKGGYDLWMAGDYWTASPCFNMVPTYDKDLELQKLLQNKQFKQALSIAIDRDEINEKVFLGNGVPCQACPHRDAFFYKEEWAKKYAEYDPDKANAMLDELGLDQRDEEGFRTKPNGDRLELFLETSADQPTWGPGSELVRDHWQAVGVRTTYKLQDGTLLSTRVSANEVQIYARLNDKQGEKALLSTNAQWLRSPFWAALWFQWYNSNGKQGMEPPEQMKRLYDLCDEVGRTPPDEVTGVMHEIFDTMTEELYVIGTIGYAGKPAITSKKLGNVDQLAYGDNSDTGGTRNNWLEIFFWKE